MAVPAPATHLLAMGDERAATAETREARLNRLLKAYGDAMSRICAAYERNAAERDDLWQDMAFALWRALATFRGECSEKSLVYRIARNRALTHRFRKRLPTEPLSTATDFADERAAQDTLAERASEREQLLAAVQQLPETQRAAVVLRLEGLDDREIADVLGVSANVVAVRLTRARESLRRVMQTDRQRAH
jgi:RNA polymerase sigma-70 factor (ECF subfamily)